ncbi:MAG TPA: S1 family peptidase [Actinomycetota bacterium]|jgi:streptogrisin D|nr:S1 family peptidase [Actinomycetota bacterium]
MSPLLPSRPASRVRLLVLGLLLAVAGLLVAPSTAAGAATADPAATADRLTRSLGAQSAGAYLDASGRMTVNVVSAAPAAQVRAAGATPKLVTRSLARLERVKAALDAAAAPVGASWGVDVPSNTVLVTVPAGAGAGFVAKARSFGAAVRVERTRAVQTQAFYGGQAILHSGSRCSAGFNTRSGSGRNYVLTAGHCTNLGGTWTTLSGQTIGPVAASSFPGNDFGAIRISNPAALDPRGGVLYNGAFRDITGASRVPVGSSACKTGSTTGTTCGTVQAYNVTVRYAEGTVSGLTRTNICTQPGDSGGAMFAGSQAQGITSGGTVGGCGAGFQSFFQPADEALSVYGLTLL